MIASLFRGVPRELFEKRIKNLFLEIQQAWNVPLEVVNDGEVTALAGAMTLEDTAVLGRGDGLQRGRRIRHPGRQHHQLAERTGLRAHRRQPGRAGR